MIDTFESYLKTGKVKKKTPDSVETQSLLEKASKRLKYMRSLNEETASLVLEDSYEAAREAAQALMSIKGFKPYSHEATISFIRDFYTKEFSDYEIAKFDRYRELRNNSIYRAEQIQKEDAQNCLEFAKVFVEKIMQILKEL